MDQRLWKYGSYALGALILLTVGKISIDLLRMLTWQSAGPMHTDASTYTFVARGLLNGVKPYTELFGSRPPGIYLIIGLSLLLTGGGMVATWIQMSTFVLMPILCALFAFWASGSNTKNVRTWILVGAAYIASALLVLYTEERSGGMQPEGFGYFFSFLYALILIRTECKSKWSILGAALAILCSAGMKEPFIFANLIIALALTKNWRELTRTFLLPLAIAGVIGIIGLLLLGLLKPYLTIYLPNMVGHRIAVTNEYNPVWLRGLNSLRVYANAVSFYPTGKFTGWTIIALWATAPILLSRAKHAWLPTILTVTSTFCWMIVVNYIYTVIFVNANYEGAKIQFDTWSYLYMAGALICPVALFFVKRSLLPWIAASLGLMYLTLFMIGAGGGYHPNFFVFAIPVYAALLLLWIHRSGSEHPNLIVAGIMLALLITGGLFYRADPRHIEDFKNLTRVNYAANKDDAEWLDDFLDACEVDRYIASVENAGFWYSKHSPWGPLIGQNIPRYFPDDHYYASDNIRNIKENTDIIMYDQYVDDKLLLAETLPLIRDQFTEDPPDCAKPFLPYGENTVLFRKETFTEQSLPF